MDTNLFIQLNLLLLGVLGVLGLLYLVLLTRKRLTQDFLHFQQSNGRIGWFKKLLFSLFRLTPKNSPNR